MDEERKLDQAERAISVHTILRLSAGGAPGEVRLSGKVWSVLAHVNGVRPVAEIARRLHLKDSELVETFSKVLAAGLVEVCERPEVAAGPPVDAATLGHIQATFARLMGPLAAVLMEEAIEGLGEDARAFPRHQLPALVEALAEQITDDGKRVQFQQAMLELLKRA